LSPQQALASVDLKRIADDCRNHGIVSLLLISNARFACGSDLERNRMSNRDSSPWHVCRFISLF
jgi:hypothetical protein